MLVEKAKINYKAGAVTFNGYELIKAQALEVATQINAVELTEENMTQSKKMLAEVNKSVKKLEDQRISIKRLYLKPYDDFEAKVKEIVSIVKDADSKLRSAVKGIEEKQKADKLEAIKKLWGRKEKPDFLKFEDVMENRFLNKTVDMKQVDDAITAKVEAVNADLSAIGTLEDAEDVLVYYIEKLDLNSALLANEHVKQARKEAERIMKINPAPETKTRTAFIFDSDFIAEQVEEYLIANGLEYEKKEL